MKTQQFSIADKWDITMLYDVWPEDLSEVSAILQKAGAPSRLVENATDNLKGWNAGYTFSSLSSRKSVACIGRATSLREFLNTIDHEVDHIQSNVSEYYGVRLGTEQAAYLQGYIGGRVFEFVANNIL